MPSCYSEQCEASLSLDRAHTIKSHMLHTLLGCRTHINGCPSPGLDLVSLTVSPSQEHYHPLDSPTFPPHYLHSTQTSASNEGRYSCANMLNMVFTVNCRERGPVSQTAEECYSGSCYIRSTEQMLFIAKWPWRIGSFTNENADECTFNCRVSSQNLQ